MESIREINTALKSMSVQKEEVKTAALVLMEDNLTKAKRALMAPKAVCPTASSVQKLESKAQIDPADNNNLETKRRARSTIKRSQSLTGT